MRVDTVVNCAAVVKHFSSGAEIEDVNVGGDFYNLVKLEDGRIACVVGDASGKGVAAAMLMSMATTMIGDGLAAGDAPACVLNNVNERLLERNSECMFITAFAAVLDPATGCLTYANAGHVPPLIVGDDVRALGVEPGDLLGLFDDVCLQEGAARLEEGEALLVFTDGVTEALNEQRTFLGCDRLEARLREGLPYGSASRLADEVVAIVDDFVGGHEQFDDVTVVAMRRKVALTRVAVAVGSFSEIREEVLAADGDDSQKRKLCLACEESFVNIVSYSEAKSIWYGVLDDGDMLRVVIEDDGRPFDPLAADPIDKDFDELDSGGMGIGLVLSLATLDYARVGNRNTLTLAVPKRLTQ